MLQRGFYEIKNFEWNVVEEENKLNVKLWLADSPVDTISTLIIKIKVEGIDLENTSKNPMVRLDIEEKSLRKGEKCIEKSWIPAISITKTNIEEIHLFVKQDNYD